MAADHTPFHRTCLKCGECEKSLTPGTLNTYEEKDIYCQVCYNNIFQAEVVTNRLMILLIIKILFFRWMKNMG